MTKYIIAQKSKWGHYDRESNYLHNDGSVGPTPSRYYPGDCFFKAFHNSKWYNTYEEAMNNKYIVGYKRNAFDKFFNPSDFQIIKVEIKWAENIKGKKYPILTISE